MSLSSFKIAHKLITGAGAIEQLAKADPKLSAAQVGRARAMLARGDADAALAEIVAAITRG